MVRHLVQYSLINATRTKRYTSFIHHALLNYQYNLLTPPTHLKVIHLLLFYCHLLFFIVFILIIRTL